MDIVAEGASENKARQPLIEVKNMRFQVPSIKAKDRQLLTNPLSFLSDMYLSRSRRKIITILDDITFTVQPGERLGVLGLNGAGKSTLLRLLAGIYQPTEGELHVNGTAKGLFDISLGMNQEATGLENIYMRGLQMRMSLKEIKNLIPEIVEFSELHDAIGDTLSTYSSGMRLRLAFSISTMVDPDILLLDEWLGAGDERFRKKISERMNKLVESSKALVLASHNTQLIRSLCTNGLVLSKGRIVFQGNIDDALEWHLKSL
ncbi:MAG: ABC transporter ATP-binding protein [Alphaproteobacteria bacterium]|nr:ABC transporter ATP-binding protein [Alphaproteobacteria bacterium]